MTAEICGNTRWPDDLQGLSARDFMPYGLYVWLTHLFSHRKRGLLVPGAMANLRRRDRHRGIRCCWGRTDAARGVVGKQPALWPQVPAFWPRALAIVSPHSHRELGVNVFGPPPKFKGSDREAARVNWVTLATTTTHLQLPVRRIIL